MPICYPIGCAVERVFATGSNPITVHLDCHLKSTDTFDKKTSIPFLTLFTAPTLNIILIIHHLRYRNPFRYLFLLFQTSQYRILILSPKSSFGHFCYTIPNRFCYIISHHISHLYNSSEIYCRFNLAKFKKIFYWKTTWWHHFYAMQLFILWGLF